MIKLTAKKMVHLQHMDISVVNKENPNAVVLMEQVIKLLELAVQKVIHVTPMTIVVLEQEEDIPGQIDA